MPYYEDENKFPGLKKALEDSNKSTREYQLKFIDQNLEFAKEMYDEDDEYYQYLETSVTPSVRRADTLVTSILYYGYEYNGGMHGESYYYGENYDTKTGKKLKLTDVVDTNMLSDAISSQLDKFYSDTFGDNNINLDEVIDDDKILSVGLQSYHFKNMEDIFGISEDEVKKNAPCKVLATSSMDVLDENLSGKELVTCPDDERWIILT